MNLGNQPKRSPSNPGRLTDPAGEQLLAALDDVAARDPVAHRKRRDGRPKARTERALGNLARQLGSPALTAARAAHPLAPVLSDRHRDRGQLLHLPAHRHAYRDTLLGREGVSAATALGPVLDHPINGPRGQQRPAPAFMTELGALLATRWILATLRRAGGRIGARGNRRVARAAVQPTLELGDPLILARDARGQRLDLGIHPQKHLHDRLTPSVIDRLRLSPLHTTGFDAAELSPPTH